MSIYVPNLFHAEGEAKATVLLERYFDPSGPFISREFDFIEPNDPYQITAVDFLALVTRGLPLSPEAIVTFLADTERQQKIQHALTAIEDGRCITDPDGEVLLLQETDELTKLWDLVMGIPGFNAELTSTLLSRKRPRLVPVSNSVTLEAFKVQDQADHWPTMVGLFNISDVKMRLIGIRSALGFNRENMSLQRLIDVALWMERFHP